MVRQQAFGMRPFTNVLCLSSRSMRETENATRTQLEHLRFRAVISMGETGDSCSAPTATSSAPCRQ